MTAKRSTGIAISGYKLQASAKPRAVEFVGSFLVRVLSLAEFAGFFLFPASPVCIGLLNGPYKVYGRSQPDREEEFPLRRLGAPTPSRPALFASSQKSAPSARPPSYVNSRRSRGNYTRRNRPGISASNESQTCDLSGTEQTRDGIPELTTSARGVCV